MAKHPAREGEWEAHHVGVVAPDKLDEERSPPLDGIPADLADVLLEKSPPPAGSPLCLSYIALSFSKPGF